MVCMIGAGTVLMPVQIGLAILLVFITAFIIAYPATYCAGYLLSKNVI